MDSAQQSFEIADPVVKQVADTGGSAAQELEGVPVAGFSDNHHSNIGVLRAQPLGGAQCRLGVNAGGADAHDEHIRAVLADGGEGFRMAVDSCDDLDAASTAEQAAQTLPG